MPVDLADALVSPASFRTFDQGDPAVKHHAIPTVLLALRAARDAGAMGMEASTQVKRAPGSIRLAGTLRHELRLVGQIVGVERAAGTAEIRGAQDTRTLELENKALLRRSEVTDGGVVTVWDSITGGLTIRRGLSAGCHPARAGEEPGAAPATHRASEAWPVGAASRSRPLSHRRRGSGSRCERSSAPAAPPAAGRDGHRCGG